MTHVLALYSIKGGVGKTTAAINLGHAAAERGARVLLWDLDPQGAATFTLRVKPRLRGGVKRLLRRRTALDSIAQGTNVPRLDLVPADFSLRHLDLRLDAKSRSTERLARKIAELPEEYDYVILDCPPGITLVSENVFAAAHALLVPVIPSPLSRRTLEQLVDFLKRADAPQPHVWPFFSMVDRRKRLHASVQRELLASIEGWLAPRIPNASEVERMSEHRQPLGAFAPHGEGARAYAELWREVETRIWGGEDFVTRGRGLRRKHETPGP